MAIIIETTDDFIRALRENEEFRAAARRELLTDDLLELPGEFREFRTQTEESLRVLTNNVNDLRGSALEAKMPTRLRQRAARTLGLIRPRTLWLAEHYVQPPSRAEAFDRLKE